MGEGNGSLNPTRKDAGQGVLTLVIQFDPKTLAIGIQWPDADGVTQLGMLEFAKANWLEQRLGVGKRIVSAPLGLAIPKSIS